MDRQLVYDMISRIIEVHLGVADKFLINRMISERNYKGLEDMFKSSREMLLLMGYEGSTLREYSNKVRVHDLAFARYWEERYANLKSKE